jgi:hypothetical protein
MKKTSKSQLRQLFSSNFCNNSIIARKSGHFAVFAKFSPLNLSVHSEWNNACILQA